MAHCAGRTTLPALVLPLFLLLSSLVRPCISLLECPVIGVVAAEDGALELLLLEATKTVVTLVVTLVYCFPWSSFCASSAQDINDGDEDCRTLSRARCRGDPS
jgi:hypothetical protein